MRSADKGEPARGGRAKGKKKPLPLRYSRFVRAIELHEMARDDKSIHHRPSHHLPISSSSRCPVSFFRLVPPSCSPRLVFRLAPRLVIASRLFSSLFPSVPSSYSSFIIPSCSSIRLYRPYRYRSPLPHIAQSPHCVLLPCGLIHIVPHHPYLMGKSS